MDLNKVQIIGRITQDIELKQTPNGQNVTSFSVATNRNYVDGAGVKQEVAEFHNVVFWGKLAEIVSQYMSKGRKIYVEGRLQTRSWEGTDGVKRYRTEIVGENMIMLDGNSSNVGFDNSSSNSNFSSNSASNSAPAVSKKKANEEEEISIEDIPF